MNAAPPSADVRIESLLGEIERGSDAETLARARALVEAVLEWHRVGLSRVLEIVREGGNERSLVGELARDPVVGNLLALHELHPTPPLERLSDALGVLEGELRALGVDARILDSRDGVVHVEMTARTARGAALTRTRAWLEDELRSRVPDVEVVIPEVGGGETLIPAERLLSGAPSVVARVGHSEGLADTCETCGVSLASVHEHLFDPTSRTLRCGCPTCTRVEAARAGTRWKRVPPRAELVEGVQWSDADWARLAIPIGLAFFQQSSVHDRTLAFYPSPAGAVESEVAGDAWRDVARANPVIRDLEPDVEALLVHRVGDTRAHYRVSIDHAYALVGLLRRGWRGLSGGAEVWAEVATFFDRLAVSGGTHA